jgi:SAM-dependent methyltransferase
VDEKNKIKLTKENLVNKMELNLLKNYPKSKRDLDVRAKKKDNKIISTARKFGKEFFDGDRDYGYGGFSYNPKYWQPVIPDFKKQYNLSSESKVLDVGCAKGFMMHDFLEIIPGIEINGIDVSEYAIKNCMTSVKGFAEVANANKLPFKDKSFDLVISINTIHNLDLNECINSIKEIQRVSRNYSFITVDAYNSEDEKKRMYDWNLTAKTIMSVKDWKKLFKEIGYNGDYYWFIP